MRNPLFVAKRSPELDEREFLSWAYRELETMLGRAVSDEDREKIERTRNAAHRKDGPNVGTPTKS
jgi:hypothetical protein